MQEEHTNLMKLAVISGPDTHVEPTQGPAGAWAVQVLWTPCPQHSTQQHLGTLRVLSPISQPGGQVACMMPQKWN